ncbi:MAG: hypothetical protein ACRCV9_14265 [Burkholderiaceae bacterium]
MLSEATDDLSYVNDFVRQGEASSALTNMLLGGAMVRTESVPPNAALGNAWVFDKSSFARMGDQHPELAHVAAVVFGQLIAGDFLPSSVMMDEAHIRQFNVDRDGIESWVASVSTESVGRAKHHHTRSVSFDVLITGEASGALKLVVMPQEQDLISRLGGAVRIAYFIRDQLDGTYHFDRVQ